MTDRLIQVFDAAGNVIASEPAKSNARRFSAQAAADQRQLDGLYRPGAVRAKIGFYTFRFDARGRSQAEF